MLELVTKSGASKTSSAISKWLLIGIRFQCKPDSSGHSTVEEEVCSRLKFLPCKEGNLCRICRWFLVFEPIFSHTVNYNLSLQQLIVKKTCEKTSQSRLPQSQIDMDLILQGKYIRIMNKFINGQEKKNLKVETQFSREQSIQQNVFSFLQFKMVPNMVTIKF